MNSYVVIGLGRFGLEVAKKLYEYGKDVLVIDRSQQMINSVANYVTRAAVGDGKNIETLKSLGVGDCDCAIVAMSSDLATSVLTTMNLKKLGVNRIVCKAHDDTHKEILEKIGANEIISPEHEIAEKVARFFASSNILEKIELSDKFGIVECKPPKDWHGKTIRDLNVRKKYGINIIAVMENNKIEVSPTADYVISPDQTLVMIGDYKDLDRFN